MQQTKTLVSATKVKRLMGNAFQITALTEDEHVSNNIIDCGIEEIIRIESLLTTYKSDSLINKINEQAGENPVVVPMEVIDLIDRAKKISDITQGAFDISFGSIDKTLWNFDKSMTALPDKEKVKASISLVNYKNIIVDRKEQTIFLKEKGMRIGFGGIGKGYAAERAKAIMKEMGCENGVVNAAGDMTVWGCDSNGQPWSVGISHPDDKSKIVATMKLQNQSIATSGDYEKYVMIAGRRYSHTINPKTGYPVEGIKSVTIICPNAELADALTTPVMVMGVDHGLHLINQIKDVQCAIIDEKNTIHLSNNLN